MKRVAIKVLVYSSCSYDRTFLESANQGKHELVFSEACLERHTKMLAKDFPAICCFVSDDLSGEVLEQLNNAGTKLITLRATGFNNVDLEAASRLGTDAVQALIDGKGGYMVGEINREIAYTPLKDTWEKKKALHVGLTDLMKILSD